MDWHGNSNPTLPLIGSLCFNHFQLLEISLCTILLLCIHFKIISSSKNYVYVHMGRGVMHDYIIVHRVQVLDPLEFELQLVDEMPDMGVRNNSVLLGDHTCS